MQNDIAERFIKDIDKNYILHTTPFVQSDKIADKKQSTMIKTQNTDQWPTELN